MNRDTRRYQVKGLTCTSCAEQLEREVEKLAGVKKARVNFSTSTLIITGQAAPGKLQQAGSSAGVQLSSREEELHSVAPWKNRSLLRTLGASLLFLTGVLLQWTLAPEPFWSHLFFGTAIFLGGWPLFLQGSKNLVALRFDMKTLMTVAIGGALAIGEWGEGALVVILFAISQVLENHSLERSRRSIRDLMDTAPAEATVFRDGQEKRIPVNEVVPGDLIRVRPGEKIPVDGVILRGSSSINQAPITGESRPVARHPGGDVFAGSINGEGLLQIRAAREYQDSTLARIIHLVEEAQAEKAPAQSFVDRFACYYTPLIMGLAAAIIVLPPVVGGGNWSDWIYRGLAMLVVACPCALIISTPVAIVSAIGNAARNGILIKGGVYLEEAGRLQTLALDKTGTLTRGEPEITDIISFNGSGEQEALPEWFVRAASLEKHSSHPLARTIVRRAEEEGLSPDGVDPDFLEAIPGRGLKASINGHTCYLGSPRWLLDRFTPGWELSFLQQSRALERTGKTVMALACCGEIKGLIAARDQLRPGSKELIKVLPQLGIKRTLLLTGDNQQTAHAIGQELGISDVHAELLPEDKLELVRDLMDSGQRVGMVGDGVNDAPTLARSSLGLALGGAGSDATLEAADIVLMADDLEKLPFTIRLSRKALGIIRQNITLALLIKALALLLIVPGWLTLWMAVLADTGATLLVTLNGMRLQKISPQKLKKTLTEIAD